MSRSEDPRCKVYVGDLPEDVEESELESAFKGYGNVTNVWVARNPPGFAFVYFEDANEADAAVRGLDGTTICGVRARVNISQPRRGGGARGGGGRGRGGGGGGYGGGDQSCFNCGGRGHFARECPQGGGGSRGGYY